MYVHWPQRSPMPTQAIRLPIGFDIPIALSHALLFSEGHHTFAATTGFPLPTKFPHEDTPEQRRAFLEQRWEEGGMPHTLPPTATGASSSRITAIAGGRTRWLNRRDPVRHLCEQWLPSD